MRNAQLLLIMILLCTGIFAVASENRLVASSNAVEKKHSENVQGQDVVAPSSSSTHIVKKEDGRNVVEVDVTSEDPVVVSSNAVEVSNENVYNDDAGTVVDIRKENRVVSISSKKSEPVVISVNTPSGVNISVTASENVMVKKGEIYFVNMTKAVDVLPNEIIAPTGVAADAISTTLTREGENYKYEIKPVKGTTYTSDDPVIALSGLHKVVLPHNIKKVYVNDVGVDYTNIDAPVSVLVKEGEQTKTMLVKQEGTHLVLRDGEAQATVRAEIEVKEREMSIEGKKVKMLPATASRRAFEVTGAIVKDMELKNVENRAVYKMGLEKDYKFLWLIPVRTRVPAEISAEDGVVLSIEQPWWAGLSSDTITLKKGDKIK